MGLAAELLSLLSGTSTPSFPLALLKSPEELGSAVSEQCAYLLGSRLTAVNLREALSRIEEEAKNALKEGSSSKEMAKRISDVAIGVWTEDAARNKKIGDHGANWILQKLEKEGIIKKDEKINVLTVR